MPRGVANAKQLAMMEKVLDGYSQRYNLTHPDDLDDAAALILDLFNAGFREEETIMAELVRQQARRA